MFNCRLWGVYRLLYEIVLMDTTNNANINNKSGSQYNKEEDRVTAEFLKILHYGGHSLVAYLFGEEFDLPSNDVIVESQVYGGASRPDGCISCNCDYTILVESKIYIKSINETQLKNHQNLLAEKGSSAFLLYITPDDVMPIELKGLPRVFWRSWERIVKDLDNYVKSNPNILIEYLVNEFKKTVEIVVYKQRKITDSDDKMIFLQTETKQERVIIVGGSWAEDVALKYGAYICQPERFFLPASYMAFCFNNRIKYLFKINGDPIERTTLNGILPDNFFTDKEPYYKGDERKFFRLELVKEFNPVIENDAKDKNGNTCAYVQRQRYTTYEKINNAKFTSEL